MTGVAYEAGDWRLVSHLSDVGYESAEPVSTAGQYSLRGGILDVCPPSGAPARMEFFGDRLESLRAFNVVTQRSEKPLDQTLILPLTEHKRSPQFFARLLERLKERSGNLGGREPDWAPEYAGAFPGWEFYAPVAGADRSIFLNFHEGPYTAVIADGAAVKVHLIWMINRDVASQFTRV